MRVNAAWLSPGYLQHRRSIRVGATVQEASTALMPDYHLWGGSGCCLLLASLASTSALSKPGESNLWPAGWIQSTQALIQPMDLFSPPLGLLSICASLSELQQGSMGGAAKYPSSQLHMSARVVSLSFLAEGEGAWLQILCFWVVFSCVHSAAGNMSLIEFALMFIKGKMHLPTHSETEFSETLKRVLNFHKFLTQNF